MSGHTNAEILLINPPSINAWSPYIGMPLLTAVLRERGWRVRPVDLNAESVDWLLSPTGLRAAAARFDRPVDDPADRNRVERARAVYPVTYRAIEDAKRTLRSEDALFDHERFLQARTTLRNALWCVSGAFDGLDFDLVANEGTYSPRSTEAILRAADDPDRNVFRWAFDHLFDELTGPVPDVVGIVVAQDTQLLPAVTAAALVKARNASAHVFLCGDFVTRLGSRWRERHPLFDLIDSLLLFECEEAVPALCDRLKSGSRGDVPGWVRCAGDELVRDDPRPVDVNALPVPDFSGVPLQKYLTPGPVLPTYASRGCPWKCAFCSIPFSNLRFRMRRPERVVAEIEELRDRWGSRFFGFLDETMTVPSLRGVSRGLIEREAGVHWYCETRFSKALDDRLAAQLHASGCRRIEFGLESYNQRVLDLMVKDTDIAVIDENCTSCLGAGIAVHLFGILGFPGETPDEARRTIRFIEDTIRRSTEEYGIPYSTSGLGTFILDPLAAVGREPERFGVTPGAPPPSEDLTVMTLDYDVDEGLDASATRGLLNETSGYEVDKPQEGSSWFVAGATKDVREHSFLRACLETGTPSTTRRERFVWEPLQDDDMLTLEPDVALSEVGAEDPRTAKTHVYKLAGDALVTLCGRWAGGLSTIGAGRSSAEIVASCAAAGCSIEGEPLEVLVRFGFLRRVSQDLRARADAARLVFKREPFVREHLHPSTTRTTLVSDVTGKAVELGPLGLWLWLSTGEGWEPTQLDALPPGARPEAMTELAWELVELGFLYAAAARRPAIEQPAERVVVRA